MGIYFSNIRSILEVKRKLQNQDQEEDLENEDEVQPNNEDEPTPPEDNNDEEGGEDEENTQDPYSMDVEDEEDNTPEDDTDNREENNDADSQDNQEDDGENEDNQEDNAEDDSYSMDVDDEEDDTTEEDPSAEEGDNTTDDESGDDSESREQGELQSLEDDLFKDLSPEQMNIKLLEIKKQYLEVYTTITDILSRTNKIPKTTENIKVLEFVTNKLMELKELVQFYLSNTFDTKTYTENLVNYQQYLVVLNTVNRLLKEINTKKGK